MRKIMPFFALAISVLLTQTHASESSLTGHFIGTGRACYGTLAITQKTISWNTAFSHCKARPFRLAENERVGEKQRLTFEFSDTAPACRFQVISLTHDENSGADSGWEATGYADLASYQTDQRSGYTRNAPDMMSCALVRDSKQDGKRGVK
jgi:hypothetical protein